jgi:hypothetical protein
LSITRDVTLALALEPGDPTIERGNEFKQVVDEGLVRSGFHSVSFNTEADPEA